MPSASEHAGLTQESHLPVETLVLRPNNPEHPSILDTVFTSRKTRRAAYATTTEGSETRVWRVDKSTGEMEEVAKIRWDVPSGGAMPRCLPGDGVRRVQMRSKRVAMISHGGRTMAMDDFMRKSKGWFPSDSKTFTSPVNDVTYKWKSGPERTTMPDSTRHRHADPVSPETWKQWRCVIASGVPRPNARSSHNSSSSPHSNPESHPSRGGALSPVPSYRSTSSENSNPSGEMFPLALRSLLRAPAPPSLLARFAPPLPGVLKCELTLFPAAYPPYTPTPDGTVDTIVVTTILLATEKDEWRTRQSIIDARSLAAHFEAEARGVIPPYTPRAPRTITSGRPRTAEERLMDQYVLTMNRTLRPLPPYQSPPGPPPSIFPAPSPFLSNRLRTESDPDLPERLFRYAVPQESGRGRSGSDSAVSPPRRLPWSSAWRPQRRPRTAGPEHNRSGTPPPLYKNVEAQITHRLQR